MGYDLSTVVLFDLYPDNVLRPDLYPSDPTQTQVLIGTVSRTPVPQDEVSGGPKDPSIRDVDRPPGVDPYKLTIPMSPSFLVSSSISFLDWSRGDPSRPSRWKETTRGPSYDQRDLGPSPEPCPNRLNYDKDTEVNISGLYGGRDDFCHAYVLVDRFALVDPFAVVPPRSPGSGAGLGVGRHLHPTVDGPSPWSWSLTRVYRFREVDCYGEGQLR